LTVSLITWGEFMSRSDKSQSGRAIAKTRAGLSNAVNGGSGVYSTKSGGYKTNSGDRFEPSKKGTGVRDHIRNKKSKCFITTAACNFKKLPDDCQQLQTLRHFRDSYLIQSAEGADLVKEYYRIAPRLAKRLSVADVNEFVWPSILECLAAIDSGNQKVAISVYQNMVFELQQRYSNT
jgi:hypothetical protein